MKWLVYPLLLFVTGFCALRFSYKHTHGFALIKTRSALKPSAQFANPPLSPDERQTLLKTLDQPFYYLGKGAQAYAFVSHDGETVIKLCRFDHLRAPIWFSYLRFPFTLEHYRIPFILHKRNRLEKEFESYQIAFSKMKEETGLIYLHLNKGSDWNQQLTLYDNIGVRHEINLDEMEFVVQKRAELIYPSITEWMRERNEENAKAAISSLISLLKWRCEQGIFDKDPDIPTNFGFLGTQAIQIDTGRFSGAPKPQDLSSEMLRITDKFVSWLDGNYPELAEYAKKELAL